MGYLTYFEGQLEIELKDPYLNKLQDFISNTFKDKNAVIIVENSLKVNDEWNNGSGIMEEIVLFIERFGKIISGSISCAGEDSKDVWEILILDNKPYIREQGTMLTLSRSSRYPESDKPYENIKGFQFPLVKIPDFFLPELS